MQELRRIRPDLPVVFMTGHCDLEKLQQIKTLARARLVHKPFTKHVLGAEIRHVLDETGTG